MTAASTSMKSRRRDAGFSLIELVMAAVVVASAGALLSGALMATNRSAALRTQRALTTQWLATELALLPDAATPGHAEGVLPAPNEAVAWTRDTEPAGTPELPFTIIRMKLSGDQTADVVTYRPLAEQ